MLQAEPAGYIGGSSTMDETPDQMPGVRRELLMLRAAIESSGIRASQLVERLAPVLFQHPAPAVDARNEESPATCLLGGEIRKLRNQVSQLSEFLELATERVQL